MNIIFKLYLVITYLIHNAKLFFNNIFDRIRFSERTVNIIGFNGPELNYYYYFYKLLSKINLTLFNKYTKHISDENIYFISYRGNGIEGAITCAGNLRKILNLVDSLSKNIETVKTLGLLSITIGSKEFIDSKDYFDRFYRTKKVIDNMKNINTLDTTIKIFFDLETLTEAIMNKGYITVKTIHGEKIVPISDQKYIDELYNFNIV